MFGFSTVTLTSLYIIVFNLVLTGFILETIKRGGASGRLRGILAALLLGVQVFLFLRLSQNSLFAESISPVSFCLVLFGWVGVVCFSLAFARPLRELLLNMPHESLLLPQGLRMFFGAGFLIQGVIGLMPKGFSILDGVFHITSAFLAFKSGLIYAQKRDSVVEIWFANVFGLLDIIVVAVGIPFALIDEVGPNHNMMYAAFFAAPIFVALHFISLWKLLITRRP